MNGGFLSPSLETKLLLKTRKNERAARRASSSIGTVTFVQAADPGGNLIELQAWSR
jgi:hypothetical protein